MANRGITADEEDKILSLIEENFKGKEVKDVPPETKDCVCTVWKERSIGIRWNGHIVFFRFFRN